MSFMLRLTASTAFLAMTKAACAAVVMGSFAGSVYSFNGVSVTDAPFSGTYSYDTDLLSSVMAGSTNTGTGAQGAVAATFTFRGNSFAISDELGSSVMIDASTGDFNLSLTDAIGSILTFDFVPAASPFTSTDLAQPFDMSNSDTSLGSFVIAYGPGATGDFTLSSISQYDVSATSVPEPAGFAVVLPALAALGFGRVRGRR